MSTSNAIAILLVEDEEFDVARVKNTLRFYSERVRIAEVVSNGRAALELLGLRPIFDLGLRLGEGTGAALAFHVIEASARLLNEMATFADAGVSERDAA